MPPDIGGWQALLGEALPIAPHALMAIAALLLGAIQLVIPKGTMLHRGLGWIWILLLGGVAVSGLFIHELRLVGLFSPIHLLSLFVLYSLWQAIRAAMSGNIQRHQRIMTSLYIFALVITGGFTLLPGRVMHTVFFGP